MERATKELQSNLDEYRRKLAYYEMYVHEAEATVLALDGISHERQLTPEERKQLFEASIVRDLDDAPSSLVDRARERLQERIQADANPS